MIQYYRVPQKKGVSKDDILIISQQYQLKDAIHSGKISKAKKIQMKNSNVNDNTISLLWTVNQVFSCTSINLSENFSFITDKAIGHICQCINLQNLISLNLADDSITDDGIQILANAQVMHSLQQLILYGNSDITSQSLIMIAESSWLKRLKKLDVHATSVDDQGINYLMKTPNSSKLQELNLSMNWKRITDNTVNSIAQSKNCQSLQILNLQDCAITNASIQNLADSKCSEKLHTLILNNSMKQKNNFISDQTLQYIAYAKYMRNLKTLQLRNTQVSSKGMRALAASLSAQFLQTLRLSYCKNIDEQVIICIKTLMQYQSFRKVYLNNTQVSKQSCQKLENDYPNINIVF